MIGSVARADGTIVNHEVDVRHGVDGWVLLDMEWNPESGLSVYDYAQFDEKGKYQASCCCIVRQPCSPAHEGWAELWNKPTHVLTL